LKANTALASDAIVPRKLYLTLDSDIPRHWCNGSAFMTHMLNTFTLLVPDNENYYIRHLSKCNDDLSDARLASALQQFCRQEAQHGIGHKAYWPTFDKLGLKYRGFVKAIGWFNYRLLEPVLPRAVHLANIACIEHINAYTGSLFLQKNLLEHADPGMKLLFYWHFAEEIEHKSVAFDVFTDLYGSYFLRLLGATLVFPLFYLINTAGTLYLLGQDGCLFRKATWVDFHRFLFRDGALIHTVRSIFDYLRPGFHPSNKNETGLLRSFFAQYRDSKHLREFPTP
jgi:predicted metal-dependent hydrolase